MHTYLVDGVEFEAVIGLEVHAELQTRSKMFCTCPVVDSISAEPNTAVCPVCAGMPGVLPVVNKQAVELGIRVAVGLGCKVAHTSIFARKNYFYPDLPKGYQISQFEYPLAEHGILEVGTGDGLRAIRIRRVHLEEDTGKLTHVQKNGESYSLVDLNRAGVPLLEIVSEPDMHTLDEVRGYAEGLRSILRYLRVNSGDMEKGVIRFEANVSVRPAGSQELGTRTEIKNLNSFRSMLRGVSFEIERQGALVARGESVQQQTLGWDEANQVTVPQRSKEDAHDYRYFPEPDLPPLFVADSWIDRVTAGLPELPRAKAQRFQEQYGLTAYNAHLLVEDESVANYFEMCVGSAENLKPRTVVTWISGELFSWMNHSGQKIDDIKVNPLSLGGLLIRLESGVINNTTAKTVLGEMLESGRSAEAIIEERGLQQISDTDFISSLVQEVLSQNKKEVEAYLGGKETLANWFFGQVMRQAKGKANPQVVRAELERQLEALKNA